MAHGEHNTLRRKGERIAPDLRAAIAEAFAAGEPAIAARFNVARTSVNRIAAALKSAQAPAARALWRAEAQRAAVLERARRGVEIAQIAAALDLCPHAVRAVIYRAIRAGAPGLGFVCGGAAGLEEGRTGHEGKESALS